MKYNVTLNGKTYEVEVENVQGAVPQYAPAPAPVAAPAPAPVAAPAPMPAPAPVQAPAPAPAPAAGGATETVTSPMPGSVFKMNVNVGDMVTAGQTLLVLEAMKMENEIPAPRDGRVVQIVAAQGSTVETGSPLIILA